MRIRVKIFYPVGSTYYPNGKSFEEVYELEQTQLNKYLRWQQENLETYGAIPAKHKFPSVTVTEVDNHDNTIRELFNGPVRSGVADEILGDIRSHNITFEYGGQKYTLYNQHIAAATIAQLEADAPSHSGSNKITIKRNNHNPLTGANTDGAQVLEVNVSDNCRKTFKRFVTRDNNEHLTMQQNHHVATTNKDMEELNKTKEGMSRIQKTTHQTSIESIKLKIHLEFQRVITQYLQKIIAVNWTKAKAIGWGIAGVVGIGLLVGIGLGITVGSSLGDGGMSLMWTTAVAISAVSTGVLGGGIHGGIALTERGEKNRLRQQGKNAIDQLIVGDGTHQGIGQRYLAEYAVDESDYKAARRVKKVAPGQPGHGDYEDAQETIRKYEIYQELKNYIEAEQKQAKRRLDAQRVADEESDILSLAPDHQRQQPNTRFNENQLHEGEEEIALVNTKNLRDQYGSFG